MPLLDISIFDKARGPMGQSENMRYLYLTIAKQSVDGV